MNGATVLVVEDEAMILLEIESGLIEAGFTVLAANDVEQAVTIFDENASKVRALLTDIRLGPGKLGWELARHVRCANPVMPVVYVSATVRSIGARRECQTAS
ncbi:response regulator [Mesorhizobium sp. B4-1-3]|uniref:response regulator n=1 Tax=Mesorhizobium sp. B4-1-3 TaxID=2589889 RepID=UPI001FEE758C|nr:response regulator [Mesorhizobium sp. B4-1-3]